MAVFARFPSLVASKRIATALSAAAFAFALGGPAVAKGPESVADVAAPLLDAVVNISTSQNVAGNGQNRGIPMPDLPEGSPFQEFFDEFFNQQPESDNTPRRVQSLGSGFVLDASGILVTNNHVIEGADEIAANFNDGTKLIAEVIGRDEKTDIAVLKVTPTKPLKAVKFGNAETLRVGDWVMAIGNPFGLGGTLTVGIVSARNRDINSGPYDNFIQTDAAINRGNSGGPLFNMEGEVVGINTAIISPTGGSIGIGFAIPAETALNVINQLREFGETRRGWLGVRIQEVTDEIAEGLAMAGGAKGALVAGVTEKGPAEAAGIQPGDVIVEFNGKPVDAMHELPRMVADEPIGKEVKVKVVRKGSEQEITVTLGRLEDAEKEMSALDTEETPEDKPPPVATTSGPLGLTLADLTADLRKEYEIAETINGVVITEVAADSAAAEKRIQSGDVIVEVAQEPVKTPADVTARIDKLKQDGRKSALLLLANKEGDLRFVAVAIE
jgi:serine protease Do